MKRVLYISYDGMTDPLGQSQVLPYIIGLSGLGYRFTLISFEKAHLFKEREAHIRSICSKHSIHWEPLSYTKKPPVLSTVWDCFKLQRTVNKFIANKVDLIHCRSYIPSLIALRVRKTKGVPFIFDMRGFWADERADGGLWDMDKWIYKKVYNYFKKKERAFIAESAHAVSLTEAGREEILKWNIDKVDESHISVIPCSADFEHFTPVTKESRKKSKEQLGLSPETPVLSYMGSLGTWYLFEDMIDYFTVYKSQNLGAKFLIVTQHDHEIVRVILDRKGIGPEDYILKFVHRENLPQVMHASDHSLFFIQQSYSKISSSPTKMGELLAMGIPIVGNSKVGDVEAVIKQLNVGLSISELTFDAYADAVEGIRAYYKTSPLKIRSRARSYYGLENGIESYGSIYDSIIGKA